MKQRQEDCNSQVIKIKDTRFFREVLLALDNNLGSVLYRIVGCPFSARNLLKQCDFRFFLGLRRFTTHKEGHQGFDWPEHNEHNLLYLDFQFPIFKIQKKLLLL